MMYRGYPAAAITARSLAPRQPRDNESSRQAVPDAAWTPTPQVSLAPDVSGAASVVNASYLPVPPEEGGSGMYEGTFANAQRYMYSMEGTSEMLAELNEKYVLQSTKLKEVEKELRLATRETAVLSEQLETAYEVQDEMEAELQRLQELGLRANRRPDIVTAIAGRSLTFSHAAFSSVFDRQWLFRLLLRLPFFASVPHSVLYEVVARCKHTAIEHGTSLASNQRTRRSLCIVVSGTAKLSTATSDDLIAYMGAEDGELRAPPVMQTGDFFGEHHLLGRSPQAGRDPLDWQVTSDRLFCVAVPVRLFRRLVLCESMVFNTWTEATVAGLLSPLYSPLRPPPRFSLATHPGYAALTASASKLRSLVTVLRRVHGSAAAGGDDKAGEDKESAVAGELHIPVHLVRHTPLLMHVLPVSTSVAGCEQVLHTLVLEAGRYFGSTQALLYEVDIAQEKMVQRVGPRSSSHVHVSPLAGTLHVWGLWCRYGTGVGRCIAVGVFVLFVCLFERALTT
jgi:hypothetical protein